MKHGNLSLHLEFSQSWDNSGATADNEVGSLIQFKSTLKNCKLCWGCLSAITIVCMLTLKKVMETAQASTISWRAIGGGVKIVRANHERADPNCRSHLKGAWKWWRREPLVLTPFWRCGWCQPASGPASGTWLAWKTRSPTRSPACTPNGRTLERSRYVASQLSEIVAKETRVKQIVTLSMVVD